MINDLRRLNNISINSVGDPVFKTYGRVLSGYNFDEWKNYMEHKSAMPDDGNVYKASVSEMENTEICRRLQKEVYGGMEIEVGYCNGKNSTMNGFEYHKGSEINIAFTDIVLFLGHTWDIDCNNKYNVENAEVFYAKKGTAFEMYQTTLHLSPCRVSDSGFKAVVVLPRGTNTELEYSVNGGVGENRLLFMKNKWMIAHPERKQLVCKGVFPGLVGENLEIHYK